ncbi:preprotein translocase subunit SecD [Mycoplasma testudineum]|uniref:Preprotein translocase subunit SecD n=1 Tax=Mycoplasma testudineum TaxID=244584 RepID=A0A4R6IC79_9MOLU|nr:hypothetical protein [Mycoplasma testudineum]TDO19850.1 preprotein translocase subunit SecD [Mycoplasma testudineum]
MLNKIKQFFKWSNPKRFFILLGGFLAAILSIVLGSTLYLNNNTNLSNEYGNGARIVAKVTDKNQNVVDDATLERATQNLTNQLSGGSGINGININLNGNGIFEATSSEVSSDSELEKFSQDVSQQANFIVTDINGKPLFFDGAFNQNTTIDYQNPSSIEWNRYQVPISPEGASVVLANNGSSNLVVKLADSNAQQQWALMTFNMSQNTTSSAIVFWYNLEEFVNIANQNQNNSDWNNAKFNPVNFAYVNNSPTTTQTGTDNQNTTLNNNLKTESIKANDYLIFFNNTTTLQNTESFTIPIEANNAIARNYSFKINSTAVDYDITVLASYFIQPLNGVNTFFKVQLAFAIAFALIALFLVITYGIFGLIGAFGLALFSFLNILFFTLLGGEWSPAVVAGSIIGFSFILDALIYYLDQIRKQVRRGETVIKAIKSVSKNSYVNLVDSSIIAIIVGTIFFYFGFRELKTFSLGFIISIFTNLIIMIFVIHFFVMISISLFNIENKLALIGIRKKSMSNLENKFISNLDFVKQSKFVNIGIVIFIVISLIVFSSLAGANQSALSGIETSIDFSGGSLVTISRDSNSQLLLSNETATQLKNALEQNTLLDNATIAIYPSQNNALNNVLEIKTSVQLSSSEINSLQDIVKNITGENTLTTYSFNANIISSLEAKSQTIAASIAFAIVLAFAGIYSLIRFRYAYSISLLIGILIQIIIMISVFVITRLPIDKYFLIAILAGLFYSTLNKFAIANRIKQITYKEFHNTQFDYLIIKQIVNRSIRENIVRNLYLNLAMIIISLVFLAFFGTVNISLIIGLILVVVTTFISTNFVTLIVYIKLEAFRHKRSRVRESRNFWASGKVEEQIFVGFNDYKQ